MKAFGSTEQQRPYNTKKETLMIFLDQDSLFSSISFQELQAQ